MKIHELFNKGKLLLEKNSPTILTGLAVAGVVATVVLAVKATPDAINILEEEKEKKCTSDEDDGALTVIETVGFVWKKYVPTAMMGVFTIACIVGANHVNMRRNAAIASLATLYQTNFEEYKEKVKEKLGEKKEQDIQYEADKSTIQRNPVDDNDIIITGNGHVKCFDTLTGRYFWSDIESIRHAENEFNRLLRMDGREPLNTLYEIMNIGTVEIGDEVGWTPDKELEFRFGSTLTPKGEPVLLIDYAVPPTIEYRDW